MVDPTRLLSSASRLYGDEMDRLWGEFLPVPRDNVQILSGGERISVADRDFEVAYTPGHASHHVSFFDRSSGVAFVGDTAGIRTGADLFVLPPTPPPDIDIDAWKTSAALIDRWQAETLFITHFGPHGQPATHLASLVANLDGIAALAKTIVERNVTDEERVSLFTGKPAGTCSGTCPTPLSRCTTRRPHSGNAGSGWRATGRNAAWEREDPEQRVFRPAGPG